MTQIRHSEGLAEESLFYRSVGWAYLPNDKFRKQIGCVPPTNHEYFAESTTYILRLIVCHVDKFRNIVNNICTGWQFARLPIALRGLTVLIYSNKSRFLICIKSKRLKIMLN